MLGIKQWIRRNYDISIDLGFTTLWNKYIHFWCLYITLWWWKCSLTFKNNANSIQIPLTVWEPAEGSSDSFTCDYAFWFNKNSTLYLLSLPEHPVRRRAGIHYLSMKKLGSERSSELSKVSQLVSGKTGSRIYYSSRWKYFQLSPFFYSRLTYLYIETCRNSFQSV